MQALNNDAQSCRNPEIIASRLTSMRNIYLRQELSTISNQIQEKYKERLPALHLVTIAAYEQVFHRQPLSLPEELRQHAIKYGLEYYQLNIKKLRMAEAQNGLCPNHDRLSCFDKKCPLHQSNINVETDENQSNLSDSHRSISNRSSLTSDNTLNSTATETNSNSPSVSSYNSSTNSMDEHKLSSPSTFSDTPSDESLYSTTTDSISENTSNPSMTTTKTDRTFAAIKSFSRTETPKIIISRPSNDSVTSNNTKNSSIITDNDRKSARKKSKDIHHRSSHKRTSRKKSKKKMKNTNAIVTHDSDRRDDKNLYLID